MTLFPLIADAAIPATNTSITVAPGAPATPPGPTTREAPFWANPIFLPLILMGVFLIFSTRTKRKQEKKVQDMLGQLKRGDRVQTIGGIIATVVEAREHDVLLKVDETNNTKIRFSRKAIHRVLDEETTTETK